MARRIADLPDRSMNQLAVALVRLSEVDRTYVLRDGKNADDKDHEVPMPAIR